AARLSQTLAESLRNNFGSMIKKEKDEAESKGAEFNPDTAALQANLDDYIAEYEFGAKRGGNGGGVKLDPVERKALQLSKDTIKRAIQAKGGKIKDVGAERITELAEKYLEQNSEVLFEQARELLDAEQRAKDAVAEVQFDL